MNLGLFGESLGYSFSASYFKAKFEREGLLHHHYSNCELPSIEAVQAYLDSPDWQGFNVTIPYKQSIIPFLDGLSPDAKAIGAVNTLKRSEGKWFGYNTDHLGFRKAIINKWPDLKPNRALVLGSGGASKAIIYALKQMEVAVQLVSRSPNAEAISYLDAQNQLLNFPLVINTSPLGTFPDVEQMPLLIPQGDLQNHYFMDLIYNPERSLWLQKAEESGAQICNGYPMLVQQAEAAWEIWNRP